MNALCNINIDFFWKGILFKMNRNKTIIIQRMTTQQSTRLTGELKVSSKIGLRRKIRPHKLHKRYLFFVAKVIFFFLAVCYLKNNKSFTQWEPSRWQSRTMRCPCYDDNNSKKKTWTINKLHVFTFCCSCSSHYFGTQSKCRFERQNSTWRKTSQAFRDDNDFEKS